MASIVSIDWDDKTGAHRQVSRYMSWVKRKTKEWKEKETKWEEEKRELKAEVRALKELLSNDQSYVRSQLKTKNFDSYDRGAEGRGKSVLSPKQICRKEKNGTV